MFFSFFFFFQNGYLGELVFLQAGLVSELKDRHMMLLFFLREVTTIYNHCLVCSQLAGRLL